MPKTYKRSYIVQHRGGWRYKRAVPGDVRDVIGVPAWSKYLGSIGKRDAEIQARALAVDHDLLIERVRALSVNERAEIIAIGGLPKFQATAEGLATGAVFVEAASNFTVDERDSEEEQAEQALEILRGKKIAHRLRNEAARGRGTLAKLGKQAGLSALVGTWKSASQSRSSHSEDAMYRSTQRFIGAVGDLAPRSVTRDHAAQYRDYLEQSNLGPRTRRKYLEHLHTLFNVALSQRIVDANPFQGIKISKAGGKFVDETKRKPFEPHQVRTIFEALPSEHPDFQWVTKLIAYHGMRSGEAAQLRKEDVTISFGVTVLRIHDEFGSVKNAHSVRTIPLHPACAEFVKYAEMAEGPWVFASFPKWKEGRRGAPYQRRATDFLRKVAKIVDRDLSMHSFRHTWTTLAAEMNMPYAVAYAITGHTLGGGEHAKYTHPPRLKEQLKWLRKVDPLGD